MVVLGLGLAALIGLSLGLLGGGGSILTVPIFVYVLGFGAKEAIAMSLAVVGATSLFGAVNHFRVGNVNVRVALIFGGVSMVGTYAGARLAVYFTGAAQLVLFAIVMLVAAYFMLRDQGPLPAIPDLLDPNDPQSSAPAASTGDSSLSPTMPAGLIVLEAIGVGVLTGLVGVGGGFLIVPALVLLGKVPMKQAVGTSLLVIAMKSATGFVGYLGQVQVPWAFLTLFTAVSIIGIFGGTYLVQFVSQRALKHAFAIFLLVMGAFILFQNRGVLRPDDPAEARPIVQRLPIPRISGQLDHHLTLGSARLIASCGTMPETVSRQVGPTVVGIKPVPLAAPATRPPRTYPRGPCAISTDELPTSSQLVRLSYIGDNHAEACAMHWSMVRQTSGSCA